VRWTLYGVPKSLKALLSRFWRGSPGEILWRLFMVAIIAVIGFGLVTLGPVGAVIGGLLITTLVSNDIRAFVADLWYRRWAKIESPI